MKLTIQDGRDSFYTFDSNRILLLTATDEEQIKQVEFSTEEAGGTETWTKDVLEQEDGVKFVQVPNEFLNGDYTRLVCYAVALDSKGEFTRQKEVFRIKYRPQPEDWFLTYSERVTFASIKALTEQYKSNASDSAELASKYAENNEDVAVESGKYSAKHWSINSNKKYEEIRSYVGSASDPKSALGSIESARANAVSDVEKQESDSIEAVGTYTSNTAIPSVSQYVEGTAKPALNTYGEQQVDSYVNGTSKPELDRYVNNEKKQVLDEYTAEKKTELDIYTSVDKKQVLDSYTENEKKTELDSHTVGLKEQLDAHTVAKAGELNEYTTGLKSELDGYTTAKEQDISEFTEQKKSEVQGVYQNDFNELKGDLIKIVNDQTVFGFIDGEYVNPSNGVIEKSTGWSRTEYIECDQYDRLLITSSHKTVYNCFYDSDKVIIKNIDIYVGENNIQVPTNAKYFILSDKTEHLKTIAIKDLRHSNGKDIDTALLLIDKIRKNEFPFNIIKYEYVSKNGDFLIDKSWARSDYIDISSFKELVINTEKSSEYNVFLDEYKSVISSFKINVGGNNITIPNGAKYIVISNTIEGLESTKINSYLSQFIKEVDEKNTKLVELVELSANLFDKNSDNIIANSIITTGGITSNDGSSVSDFIPVISGKRYTTMYINKEWTMIDGEYDYSNSYSYSRNYVAFYDENKNVIGISNEEPYQAPLIPSDCKYIRVAFDTNKIDTFMVIPDHIANCSGVLYADYEPSNMVDTKNEVFNNSNIKGIARLGYNVTGIDTPPQQTIESFDLMFFLQTLHLQVTMYQYVSMINI